MGRDTGKTRSKQRAKTEPVCAARVTDRALPRPMMNVRPDGPRNDEEGHGGERRSLQNSNWFVRSDLRSLSRTVSMVPLHGSATIARVGVERSRTPVAMTVTPHTRSQLSSA